MTDRATRLLKKLDTMPGTNVDLKDAVRAKLRRNPCPAPSSSCSSSPSGSTSLSSSAAAETDPSLPYARGRETSKAAADSMRAEAPRIREEVYAYVKDAGAFGVTCDETEAALFLTHQTCSARFFDLHKAGRIVDTGRRRPTRSGRRAIVWEIKRSSS